MKSLNILQTISVQWWNACAYYAVAVSRGLADLKHNIFFTTDYNSPPFEKAVEYNLDPILVNYRNILPHNFILQYYKLKSIIIKNNISIVNTHRPEDHFLCGMVCKNLELPVIRTVGDVRPPNDNRINKWLHLNATDYFIFSSESNLIRYISVWPEIESKSAIILGGVDSDIFYVKEKSEELLKKLELNYSERVIGIVGRLSITKDLHTFLFAAKLVVDEFPNTKFLISGEEDTYLVESLLDLSSQLDLADSLKIIDKVDSVADLISVIDIGIIASRESEAITRIGMEFISMGKPVVATNVNVLPEVVKNGRNGFIVEKENPVEMANHIIELLKNQNLYNSISKNNINDGQNIYSLKYFAEQTEKIYAKFQEP